MKKQLSVVMPAYNEADYIGHTLEETAAFLERGGYEYEVLVINDGSRDATARVVAGCAAQYPKIRLIDLPANRGKGEAVKRGVAEATYPVVLFMDADNSTSIAEWDRFQPVFESGAACVIASRHLPGSRIETPQPWMRRFLGSGYRALCRGLFGLTVSDINCGFKAYQTDLAKRIFPRLTMNDWTFDVELLCLLKTERARVVELPVRWQHYGKASHLPPWRTALRTLNSLARLKKRF